MNNLHDNTMDRLMDLLAARATQGLSDAESAELKQLLLQYPNVDEHQLDMAAAALASGFASTDAATPLTESLRQRIERQIPNADVDKGDLRIVRTDNSTRERSVQPTLDQITTSSPRSNRQSSVFGNVGWLVAAACLGLAIFAWLPKLGGPAKIDDDTINRFVQTNVDAFTIAWTDFNALDTNAPPEVRNVKGQVVWSDKAQGGFMRFDNLPKNDPIKESYQLWIIDAERGLAQRVSGAVFNVSDGNGTIVPIEPQLPISKASIFAITIERPGGVVVSDMSRRVSLAARQ